MHLQGRSSSGSQNPANSVSLMVGSNFKVGKKIGSGNFGELRLGKQFLFFVSHSIESDDQFDCDRSSLDSFEL
jgi:hypothetical protein